MPSMHRRFGCARNFWTMLLVALLSGLFATQARASGPTMTSITDVVYRANGQPAAGTIVISWAGFTTADNKAVPAGQLSVVIAVDGSVNLQLAPNANALPGGSFYKAVYKLTDGTSSTEYWVVPAVASTTIGAIRSQIVPSQVATQFVSRAYVDTAVAAKADDAAVVHKAGAETVTGLKTLAGLAIGGWKNATVATLPNASSASYYIYQVTDGNSATDCTVGGGSIEALCYSNGISWAAYSGGLPSVQTFSASGADFGTQMNTASTNLGSSKGQVYAAQGAYTQATQIAQDDTSNLSICGAGGLTAGAAGATWDAYSGTAIPVSLRSNIGDEWCRIYGTWTNAAFTGPFIDLSHSLGLGSDASGWDIHHFYLGKSGSGGTATSLISTDKANNGYIHDAEMRNYTAAIVGMSSNTSYSNNVDITRIDFQGGTAVKSAGQDWHIHNTTHELTSTTGNKILDCTVGGNACIDTSYKSIWAGDDVTTQAETLFDSPSMLSLNDSYVSGAQAYTTVVKPLTGGTVVSSNNDFNNLVTAYDFSNGGIRAWIGPNAYNNVTNVYTGTPSYGILMNGASGDTLYFGPHRWLSGQIRAFAGTSAAPGLGFDSSPSSGWFWNSNGRVQRSFAGTPAETMDATGVQYGSSQAVMFANNVDPNAAGSFDTRISRGSAGVVSIDTTAIGNHLGTVNAATYQVAGAQIACSNLAGAAASCSTDTTNAGNISSGTLGAARLPNPSATTLGGVESLAAVSHNWINTISTSGVPSATQPAFTDISGSVAAGQMPALTGDCTTSAGTVSVVCGAGIARTGADINAASQIVRIQGALIPVSAGILATNASSQLVAATAHGLTIENCAAASASGTAYTCSTSPTFTPASGDQIYFKADVANTGAATVAVNGAAAAAIKKQGGGTALVANDLLAGTWTVLKYDGTNWQMLGQLGNAAAGGMTNPMTTLGDIIYENATPAPARLAGPTTNLPQVLTDTPTSGAAVAPAWSQMGPLVRTSGNSATTSTIAISDSCTAITIPAGYVSVGDTIELAMTADHYAGSSGTPDSSSAKIGFQLNSDANQWLATNQADGAINLHQYGMIHATMAITGTSAETAAWEATNENGGSVQASGSTASQLTTSNITVHFLAGWGGGTLATGETIKCTGAYVAIHKTNF